MHLLILATSLSALYSTLDPSSVAQHFAFYELYPKSQEGKDALKHAWELLSKGDSNWDPELILPSLDPQPLISFVNRTSYDSGPLLEEELLNVVEKLALPLANRKLQGHKAWDVASVLKLHPEEIDLARGLLLAELEHDPQSHQKVRSYEASLDLMALQIAARLPENATALETIRAMNDYVFAEMRFRFPPHSLHAKDIDLYTFLPSVLDSRRGVCLGVSILYLCLAQRLGVDIEAITPPGHIYVRHVSENGDILNIETTARGIDVPSVRYLGLETRALQQRDMRQVIGLAFFNQASVSWHKEDPKTAIELYEKARLFLGDDYLVLMFLGFNHLFAGQEKEGRQLLEKIRGQLPNHLINPDTVIEDYLDGHGSPEAIQAIYSEVNESRASTLDKQKKLQKIVTQYPRFRQGHFHLAVTWLQLGREKEALPILEQYATMNPNDATVRYYLAAIYHQRRHFNKAWEFLRASEQLVHAKDHHPQALQDLRQSLEQACPEP